MARYTPRNKSSAQALKSRQMIPIPMRRVPKYIGFRIKVYGPALTKTLLCWEFSSLYPLAAIRNKKPKITRQIPAASKTTSQRWRLQCGNKYLDSSNVATAATKIKKPCNFMRFFICLLFYYNKYFLLLKPALITLNVSPTIWRRNHSTIRLLQELPVQRNKSLLYS